MPLFRRRAAPAQLTHAEVRLNARLQPKHRIQIYERPLEMLLADAAPGSAITGGGSMITPNDGIAYCDLELSLTGASATTTRTVIDALESYGAPIGSWVQIGQDPKIPFGRCHGFALSLDGTSLPEQVYRENDVNDLISILSDELGKEAALQSWWEGNGRTTMYFYGLDADHITTVLSSAESRFPLAQKSTVTRLT